MGGVRGGWRQQACRITSTTPSIFLKTSWFQKRKVLNPCSLNQDSLSWSWLCCPACCPPSSSMISLFSKHTKSAIYCPMDSWRRNLSPLTCLLLRCHHKSFSASVCFFLSDLAKLTRLPTKRPSPPPNPPPSRGREYSVSL
jgi:hypothetical protein